MFGSDEVQHIFSSFERDLIFLILFLHQSDFGGLLLCSFSHFSFHLGYQSAFHRDVLEVTCKATEFSGDSDNAGLDGDVDYIAVIS